MRLEMVWIILGMVFVTFIPRFLPMALFTKWTVPERLRWGLEYIPVAVLSAIVFPMLFFDGGGSLHLQPRAVLAALPVFALAWFARSIWGCVILGMVMSWGLGFVL